jgi:hypothetical protein
MITEINTRSIVGEDILVAFTWDIAEMKIYERDAWGRKYILDTHNIQPRSETRVTVSFEQNWIKISNYDWR